MKKAFSLLLVLVMLLSLCACGKNGAQITDPSQTTTDNTEEPIAGTSEGTQAPTEELTTTPTEEPTAAPTETPTTKPTETPTTKPTETPTTKPTTCSHSYNDATCTTPKTCSKCGETTGNALGHSYKAATCTAPKTCSKCGTTSGNALGHSFKDATCTTAKTCTKCGETNGKAIGHNYSNGICLICNGQDPNYVEYTILYNANGGWGETVSSVHYKDETRSLSKNGFKRAGYVFKGWAMNSNSNTPTYLDAQSVTNLTSVNGDTIILYAIWEETSTSQFDECKPTSRSNGNVEYHTTATDNLGNTYNDVAVFANRDEYRGYKRWDERYVNGMFTRIQGTLHLSNAYKIDNCTSIRLIIKADGVIVYQSEFFEEYSGSQTFDIDITGVNVLEIYVEDPESNSAMYWNRGGDIIVQDLLLCK